MTLKRGDEVATTFVGGDFVLSRDPRAPALLIAAGIGITPILAHLASGAAQARDVVLLVLVLARNPAEISCATELQGSGLASWHASETVPSRRRSSLIPVRR